MSEAFGLVENRGRTDFSRWFEKDPSMRVKRSIDMLTNSKSPNFHAHLVFCWVLKYDLTNRNILECEDIILNLVERAFDEAKDLNVRQPERYQKPVATLRDIFADGIILRPWNDFASYADSGSLMHMLEICADIVDIQREDEYIDTEDQLGKLSQEVEDLLAEVTGAELNGTDLRL